MTSEQKLITCVVPASEEEPERQCRAAAFAQATMEGVLLDGKPRIRYRMHRGVRYLEATWQTRPEPRTGR